MEERNFKYKLEGLLVKRKPTIKVKKFLVFETEYILQNIINFCGKWSWSSYIYRNVCIVPEYRCAPLMFLLVTLHIILTKEYN